MVNYDLIPQFIMNKSIFLKELGILEHAWKFDDIKIIIRILDKKKLPILGGDVYKIDNGKISQTYDSWYIIKTNDYGFYSKSYENTMSYISNYETKNKGQFVYTLVF